MSHPCLILAAGFGTRMGALTADRPKPLIEVAGRSLLDRALDVARDAGCAPIAVNAHYRADQVATHLAGADDVTLLTETPGILDSGGAVKNARNVLGPGPILTLNADNTWSGPNPLAALAAAFDPSRMGALLLLIPRNRAVGRQGPEQVFAVYAANRGDIVFAEYGNRQRLVNAGAADVCTGDDDHVIAVVCAITILQGVRRRGPKSERCCRHQQLFRAFCAQHLG